ncbi:MAG: GNAT family N-acetyltransferase [Rhodospirillales bacterium]|nr:GNAT family N-acetyltransferase [Rhodospirillales bacterium]MCB9997189.1 GNAT family N-acetyltransferase [Rhodospirillales bacterium]
MSFTIRPVTEDDLPALSYIHVQGWKDAYGGMVDQAYLDSLDPAQREIRWREWFDPEQKPVFMAFDAQDNPAGFVNFGRLQTPPPGSSPIRPLYSGEVYAIYILSPYWRQGLGTELMRVAAQGLSDMRHKSLCLWVLEKNARAVSFYKKRGGERCGKKDIEIGPSTAREICFGWRDTAALL